MKSINVIVAKKTNDIISTNRNNVTLKSEISPAARLDNLNDVNASGEVNGAVPVYDAATDKYIVKKLDISEITNASQITDVDGGFF